MELSLFQSKYDALKTKQDSEMRSKLEEEVSLTFLLFFCVLFLECFDGG